MKKSLFTFLFVVLSITLLAACGGTTKESTKENENAGSTLYDEVKQKGVLNIGTEGTYAPFSFHDASGKLTGYDVEVAEEVAKRLGVKANFMETQWDAIFAGLDSKRFDMIANQVGIQEDRQAKYDFSEPYTKTNAVLIIRENEKEIQKFEDIKGKKAAQTLTSNFGEIAQSYGAEIVKVDGFNQAVDLVVTKRVDGTFNDKLSALDYLKQKPDAPIKLIDEEKEVSKSALLFRKDSGQLVEEVNKALNEMKKDGTLKKISEKWFAEDVSQ
ncbi:amino acid ABC transporter substrate-binding protein [Bacillus sp. B190/17]|uniref:Amino acid ABC transporter substrate-binding protein n=1 Tax=Bacillus lumedeiriae TaxID=3058829 RepID=A0ABW8I9Z8_9BACI